MKILRLTAFLPVFLVGCASSSGVIPIGPDTYLMSKEAATGFSGIGNLKTEILRDAAKHCISEGKTMQIVSTTENAGPYILGNYPRAEIQYMCLNSNDPELQRPKLRKTPDAVIEVRK